jgi:hypothetical protein
MTDLTRWNKLSIGTPITGFCAHGIGHIDNMQIVAIGYDWAVLRVIDSGRMVPCILEPDDTFLIGEHEWDEKIGCYTFKEAT